MKEFFSELRDFSYWFVLKSAHLLSIPMEKLVTYCRSETEELFLAVVYMGVISITLYMMPKFIVLSISVIYFYAMLMIAIRICEDLWYSIKR